MTERAARIVRWACGAIGTILMVIGVLLLVRPLDAPALFGAAEPARTMAVATGIRQIYLGGLVPLLAWRREWHVLGLVLVTMVVIPIGDFLLAWTAEGGTLLSASRHAASIPLVLALGAFLLARSSGSNVEGPQESR